MKTRDFPLSADSAFVVHFARPENPGSPRRGRIEHVSSGRATRFQDGSQLMEFVAAVLAAVENDATDPPSHRASN